MKKFLSIDNILGVILILFIISIFVYGGIILPKEDQRKLKKEGLYTIGITERKYKYRIETVDYYYYYQNKRFKNSNGSKKVDNMTVPNGRYYVVFLKQDPSIAYILFDYSVPESIKEAPEQGWTLEELKNIDSNIDFTSSNITNKISFY